MADPGPTTLYRLHDSDGTLLYVGISSKGGRRLEQHSYSQPWWPDGASVAFEEFPGRAAAAEAERRAITDEKPLHNVIGKPNRAADRHGDRRRRGGPRVLQVRDFPKDLHARLRVAAAQEGVPLRTLVIAAVEHELERRQINEEKNR